MRTWPLLLVALVAACSTDVRDTPEPLEAGSPAADQRDASSDDGFTPGTSTPDAAFSEPDAGVEAADAGDVLGSEPDAGSPGNEGGSTGGGGATLSCMPAERDTREGGGRCEDLNEAWTGRGINVGYYPFRVIAPTVQYSGDFSGNPSTTFQAGATSKGVVLQVIPAGAYVGLSSNGPWYDPPTGCFPTGEECGAPYRAACGDSSPPMRPGRAGFYWGYAYGGASHMQGWISLDPQYLAYAGDDPNHPCALGPAGLDYEVASACGHATSCRGTNPTCGGVNKCDEGKDDCGRTVCGATAGGALTPSAHRMSAHLPSGIHTCTQHTPPDPSVKCLANGTDPDFFFVYPFGAYTYWAQNSTTKFWLHYGDRVQVYFHNRDAQNVLWDFVEVIDSGAPVLTPKSDGAGGGGTCSATNTATCTPCKNGGSCGWIQDVFLQ